MRNAGRKFHLQPAQRSRAMSGYDTDTGSETQHQKDAETDRQVSHAKVGYGGFQRSGFVLHEQSHSLANEYRGRWPAAAAARPRRTTAAESSDLAKLSRTSNEIQAIVEGGKILRS